MPFLNKVGNSIINCVLRNTTFTTPGSPIYVALHTGDPGQTGANEVPTDPGDDYERKAIVFTDPESAPDKHSENTANIEFTNMPAVTVTYVSIWTHQTSTDHATHLWWTGALVDSKSVDAGDVLRLDEGEVNVELDPA